MSFRDDLDAILWADLNHAYGSAADTPGALLELLSEDAGAREGALDHLWNSICHQGSVYEASCAAVPYLIRILREGPAAGRQGILDLLAGLAHRDWYANRDRRVCCVEWREGDGGKRTSYHAWWSPGEFLREGNIFHEPQWMARAHALVAEGLPDYLALIEDNGADVDTRCAALRLLSSFREKGERITPALEALLREAPHGRAEDVRVETVALFALGALLLAGAPEWQEHLRRLAPASQPARPAARYAAAAALATYHPAALPPKGVETLIEAIIAPDELDDIELGFGGFSVHSDACLLLGGLGAPAGVAALATALSRGANGWHIQNTMRVAEALLDTAFFGAPVQERSWGISREFKAANADKRKPGFLHWWYSVLYSRRPEWDHDIDCSGYVADEAERIRERVACDGVNALSPDERLALEVVVACDPLWRVSHNLLDIYGLPRERDALAALLAGVE